MFYELYKDSQNLWRWRLKAANYRIVADSGESYYNKADAIAGINLVKGASSAPVREV